jgi:SAM-dependent methyltransferase
MGEGLWRGSEAGVSRTRSDDKVSEAMRRPGFSRWIRALALSRPPGTILQHMYVEERLRNRLPGTFIEIGVGRGFLTKLLLDLGWRGVGLELNPDAIEAASALNADARGDRRLEIQCMDWFSYDSSAKANLIISSMVLEHLDDQLEKLYFEKCRALLEDGGLGVLLVPASPLHWGIEDDIVGHHRRYTPDQLRSKLTASGFRASHLVGLTYPLSNVLLPLSNHLMSRYSPLARRLSPREQTKRSGMIEIRWKTKFPRVASLFINAITLYPFHILQKMNRNNKSSLILYVEFERIS